MFSFVSIVLTKGTELVFAPLHALASLPAFLCTSRFILAFMSLNKSIGQAVWQSRAEATKIVADHLGHIARSGTGTYTGLVSGQTQMFNEEHNPCRTAGETCALQEP